MPSKVLSLFGSRQVHFRGTSKPITPFGGLISLVEFFGKLRLTDAIQEFMPLKLNSPNAIPPAHTLTAFFFSVIVGASRFAHSDWLRADKALHAMLGFDRFPGTDTIRNFFSRFSQAAVESFWRPLWRWLLPHFAPPQEGFSLDLDSTIFQRSGRQQGAAKGYNPQRPGRKSHHPPAGRFGRGSVRSSCLAAGRQHQRQSRSLPFSEGSPRPTARRVKTAHSAG
jgi:hypothetical protein